MAENKISYLNRNYDDYRKSLIEITRQYYPDVFANLNDASIGEWLIELMSDIGDNLQFAIDRAVQETTIDSASEFSSVLDMARTAGLRVDYKKAALVEVELSCVLPIYKQGTTGNGEMNADESFAPIIKRGTKFSNGTTTFELNSDVDFTEQFDEEGYSNRQMIPNRDSNGNIISYTYKKLATASACQSKIMKKVVTSAEIKPFMEVTIEDSNVLGVESILMKDGTNNNTDPRFSDFYVDDENIVSKDKSEFTRYFEVENLADQYRFGQVVNQTVDKDNGTTYYEPVWKEEWSDVYEVDDKGKPTEEVIGSALVRRIAKGKWKRLKHKFTTEYSDGWKLKITFGAGIENEYGNIPDDANEFVKYQMSRMTANDYMGVLPKPDTTLYILYRIGGGEISNIPANTLTNIINLDVELCGNTDDAENDKKKRQVRQSISVTNPTPSYGGKDAPTVEEIKHLIRYNNGAQNRCVTLKDYYARIAQIPAKYGCPFRHGVIEENNKVVVYALGLDNEGHLMKELAEGVADNIKEYLTQYRMINDFVEIKSGKIINLHFRLTVYIDKSYDKAETTKRIIDLVYNYMDIRKHMMGEDIFIGDLQKEISKLDGVINLVKTQVYNVLGNGYSEDVITQRFVDSTSCCFDEYESADRESIGELANTEIDLKDSDYMLFNDANSMFEIRDKAKDIKVIVKTR